MTTATLLAILRDRICDTGGSRWTDTELYGWLNDGYLELAHRLPDDALWPLCKYEATPLVSHVVVYDLPTDCLRERGVQYKRTWSRRWEVVELGNVNSLNPADERRPEYYVWGGQVRFINSVTTVVPGYVTVYYVKVPAQVSAPSQSSPRSAPSGRAHPQT